MQYALAQVLAVAQLRKRIKAASFQAQEVLEAKSNSMQHTPEQLSQIVTLI